MKMLSLTIPKTVFKAGVLVFFFAAIIFFQYEYDSVAISNSSVSVKPSPDFIHVIDLGFHAPVASFTWISTIPEILDLFFHGKTDYISDLDFVTSVDPKMSYPYAFSVLTLPALTTYPNVVSIANAIGARGLATADPDWRIPFYMATNYYLDLKDRESALRYYDIAARTPGVPSTTQRFAINFSAGFDTRTQMKSLWITIRDTTNDDFTKRRAQAYIDRLNDLDFLEAAAKQYKATYGMYPKTPEYLVSKNIIPQLPQDPFGFSFIIKSDGSAMIDVNNPPQQVAQ